MTANVAMYAVHVRSGAHKHCNIFENENNVSSMSGVAGYGRMYHTYKYMYTVFMCTGSPHVWDSLSDTISKPTFCKMTVDVYIIGGVKSVKYNV